MNFLIAFGSTEGHTRKIVHHIAEQIRAAGNQSTCFECGSYDDEPDLSQYDSIILAGSVHQQSHQPALVEFVKKHLSAIQDIPSAFISVSLSVTIKNGMEEAEKYVADFLEETHLQPDMVHMAGGAIRFLEYDFFKRFTIEQIVLQGNEMPDATKGNPEYTDWKALDEFIQEFVEAANKE